MVYVVWKKKFVVKFSMFWKLGNNKWAWNWPNREKIGKWWWPKNKSEGGKITLINMWDRKKTSHPKDSNEHILIKLPMNEGSDDRKIILLTTAKKTVSVWTLNSSLTSVNYSKLWILNKGLKERKGKQWPSLCRIKELLKI